jgi:uncharacterized delta-60 repeat protein
MTRVTRHVGIILGLSAGVVACGALEGLGPPPEVVTPDASSPADASTLPDADASTLPDAPVTTDSDSGPAPDAPADSSASPAFSLSTSATQVNIVRGSSAQVPLTLVPSNGFDGAVVVSVSGLPGDVTAGSLTFDAGTTSATLTLSASLTATLGLDSQVAIEGTAGPLESPSLSLPIVVQDKSGTLDSTFGTGGIATIVVPGATNTALGTQGLAIQADGKIAFCGVINDLNDDISTLLVGRMTADGAADPAFATNGLFTSNALGYLDEVGSAIRALPSNGGLACAGFAFADQAEVHEMFVVKFLDDGGLDTTFAGGLGVQGIAEGNVDSKAGSLAIQPDGKLILGGYLGPVPALVRLNADGSDDPTFDPSQAGLAIGVNTYPDAGGVVQSLGLLPSGEILAGMLTSGANLDVGGFRFMTDGGIDPTYGSGGVASTAVPASLTEGTIGVLIQGESSIYVGSTPSTLEAARFLSDGGLDPTFGEAGVASTAIPDSSSVTAFSVASTADGGFVVATQLATATPIGVARFTADGALDTTFAGVGYTGISGPVGYSEAVAVDAVGRIVLAVSYSGVVTIARFWP